MSGLQPEILADLAAMTSENRTLVVANLREIGAARLASLVEQWIAERSSADDVIA